MSIWWALFFMALGGAIVEVAEVKAWQRYREGKVEGESRRATTRPQRGG